MIENEFYASRTFAGMTMEEGQEYTWKYENSEQHGIIVLHWFSSSGDGTAHLIGVAAADRNNRWLGSAWNNLKNATETQHVIRDLCSARLLMEALADVAHSFFQEHSGFWNLVKVFFSFIFNGQEKNIELIRALCLCELRNAAIEYEYG